MTELRRATELTRADLARLFTVAYEGYFVPFAVDEAHLAHMVDAFDLGLDRSLVASIKRDADRAREPSACGERTWLGGVGVVPAERRRGVGELLTRGLLEQARDAGATLVVRQREMVVTL